MFRSKRRPLNIPQYEHGRLSGVIAQHWGNERFGRPGFDFDKFVTGVALHDWHYGFADHLPIIDADEADWRAMTRKGIEMRFDDPIVDVIIKLHLRRLLSYMLTPERQAMMDEIDSYVSSRVPETDVTRAEFDWADTITCLCDNVAFFFAFEAPYKRTQAVGNRWNGRDQIDMTFDSDGEGTVTIDPWPLGVPQLSGMIIGFERDGYPNELRPVPVPYVIRPV